MIGRQFAKDALFLEKLKLEKINDKTSLVLDSIKELDNYKYLNTFTNNLKYIEKKI